MNKRQARQLRDFCLTTRRRLGRWEERCWQAQKKLKIKPLEAKAVAAHDAHDDIGYAINRLRDELKTAADNIQYEVGALNN